MRCEALRRPHRSLPRSPLEKGSGTTGLHNRMRFRTHDTCYVGAPDAEFKQILKGTSPG